MPEKDGNFSNHTDSVVSPLRWPWLVAYTVTIPATEH